jgi:quercetin dioxygenase-like cupin family protein
MKTILVSGAACAALVCFAVLANDKASAKAPKAEAVTISASELKWGPAPAVFPPGAQVAVLHGNPFQKGVFALRLKMPDGYRIPPHWHTQDEQLTIVSGTFLLGMGEGAGDAHTLEAGAYHFLPGKMHHYASTKGDTVVEVHGPGPFDIHYLNPADDPTKATAAAAAK